MLQLQSAGAAEEVPTFCQVAAAWHLSDTLMPWTISQGGQCARTLDHTPLPKHIREYV